MNESILLHKSDCPWQYLEGEEGRADAIRWKTLLGGAKSRTGGITFWLCEFPPGSILDPHYHAEPEVYYIHSGESDVLIGDTRQKLVAGAVLYIPGNLVHGIKNIGKQTVRMTWIFPVEEWNEVVYHMQPQIEF